MLKSQIAKLKNSKGFTLVEMVVVIAIIGILIALLIPNVAALIGDASDARDQSRTKNIHTATSAWAIKHVKDGYSISATATAGVTLAKAKASATVQDLRIVAIDAATANTNMKGIWVQPDGTTVGSPIDLLANGDAYLPNNTLNGGVKAFIYITNKGTVNGVVLADAQLVILGVAGSVFLDADGLAVPAGVTDFSNAALVGLKINATGKTIS